MPLAGLVCAVVSACTMQPTYQTKDALFCQRFPQSPACAPHRLHFWWQPDVRIVVDAASGPMIRCQRKNPSSNALTVDVRVINVVDNVPGWPILGQPGADAPAFWTRVDVTYQQSYQPPAVTKTYYVNSAWTYAGLSTTGSLPALTNGVLARGAQADVYVTFDSSFGNLARDVSPHENIDVNDAPFTVHVWTNAPDPSDPSAPLPDIGFSDATVTCQSVS